MGSPTVIGANLRSRAASFSIYFLYSSRVVAPINCSSPLASMGFNILAASMLPSAEPAPTMVWISSINNITFLSLISSFNASLKRSSNSPLYFAPAIIPPRSRLTTLLFLRSSGTLPSTILEARPSAIADLPTPGSPISTGLFLVLLMRT